MQHAERILFVDDDPMIRRALQRTLSHHDIEVDAAANATEAEQLAERVDYAVVALDYRMPGEDGFSVRERLTGLQPDATFMLISGACDLPLTLQAVNERSMSYVIPKPWNEDELLTMVRRAMEESWERALARKLAAANVARSKNKPKNGQTTDIYAQLVEQELGIDPDVLHRRCWHARQLANLMELDEDIQEDIALAAMISPALEAGEQCAAWQVASALIETHPRTQSVMRLILEKDERWDGKGPMRRMGLELSKSATLLQLAQDLANWEAAGISPNAIRVNLAEASGAKYAPQLAHAFLSKQRGNQHPLG